MSETLDTCEWVLDRLKSAQDWYSFSNASYQTIRDLKRCLDMMVEEGRLETMEFNGRPYHRVRRAI